MGESKKGKADKVEKTGQDSLLVALTVTAIAAAAVIGYSAGQVKIAKVAYKEIRKLASLQSEGEAASEGKISLSEDAYDNLVLVCNSIAAAETDADAEEAGAEVAE